VGGRILAQAHPPTWVNSPSSRDSPSAPIVGIINIPPLYIGIGMVMMGLWKLSRPGDHPYLTSRRGNCAKSVISAESVPKASDDSEEEQLFRDSWEDETQREVVVESLKADCEVRRGGLPRGFEIDSG
jgi:hypothetical protein